MFQLPIHTGSKMPKLKLWSDLSSDMITCMNTITMGIRGCLHQAQSVNVRRTDTWLS